MSRLLTTLFDFLDFIVFGLAFLLAMYLVFGTGKAKADEKERERRAVAAWHMTAPAVSAASPACECEKGTRGPFGDQFVRCVREHRVMVAFFGGEPRCCHGTLIGVASQVPAGYSPARPIVIYYPIDGYRIAISETLPGDASNAELVRAVKSAQVKMHPQPK